MKQIPHMECFLDLIIRRIIAKIRVTAGAEMVAAEAEVVVVARIEVTLAIRSSKPLKRPLPRGMISNMSREVLWDLPKSPSLHVINVE